MHCPTTGFPYCSLLSTVLKNTSRSALWYLLHLGHPNIGRMARLGRPDNKNARTQSKNVFLQCELFLVSIVENSAVKLNELAKLKNGCFALQDVNDNSFTGRLGEGHFVFSLFTKNILVNIAIMFWVAAIAPWFHLRLPSCSPRFESQAHRLCFFQFVLLKLHRENDEINKKRPGLAHFF